MPRHVIPWQHMFASFLGAVLWAACAHVASGVPSGAQGVGVDRSFENAEVGSLGGTRLSGENPEIAIQVSEPSPADGARVALLNPSLSADVAHSQGRDMTVVFSMQEENGNWRTIKTLEHVD